MGSAKSLPSGAIRSRCNEAVLGYCSACEGGYSYDEAAGADKNLCPVHNTPFARSRCDRCDGNFASLLVAGTRHPCQSGEFFRTTGRLAFRGNPGGDIEGELLSTGALRSTCSESLRGYCLECAGVYSSDEATGPEGNLCPIHYSPFGYYSCNRCDGRFELAAMGAKHPCRSLEQFRASGKLAFDVKWAVEEGKRKAWDPKSSPDPERERVHKPHSERTIPPEPAPGRRGDPHPVPMPEPLPPPAPPPTPEPARETAPVPERTKAPSSPSSGAASFAVVLSLVAAVTGGVMAWPEISPFMPMGGGFFRTIGRLLAVIGYAVSVLLVWLFPIALLMSSDSVGFRRLMFISWPILFFVWPALGSVVLWAAMMATHLPSIVYWPSTFAAIVLVGFICWGLVCLGAASGIKAPWPANLSLPSGFKGMKSGFVWIGFALSLWFAHSIWVSDIYLPGYLHGEPSLSRLPVVESAPKAVVVNSAVQPNSGDTPEGWGARVSRFGRDVVSRLRGLWTSSTETRVPTSHRKPGNSWKDCSDCPEMVVLPPGSYRMGARPGEEEAERLETSWRNRSTPLREVAIGQFAIARTEVTRAQFRRFADSTGRALVGCHGWANNRLETNNALNWSEPGFRQDDSHPVVCVSWDDAQAYVAWLSERTGRKYRLPTESEWEYAARAGSETRRHWGDDGNLSCKFANSADQTLKLEVPATSDWFAASCSDGFSFTAPAGRLSPNGFGLYDMLGNVFEWAQDCWKPDYTDAPRDSSAVATGDCSRRVARGGSWYNHPGWVRSAHRFSYAQAGRLAVIGFRVATSD